MQDIEEPFSALFKDYTIVEPSIQGKACGHKLERMCVVGDCEESSFHCEDKRCDKSFRKHCRCKSATLFGITDILQQHLDFNRKFLTGVFKMEDAFIEEYIQERDGLSKRMVLGSSLQEKYQKIVQQIYKEGNVDSIKGKEARQFFSKLLWLSKVKRNSNGLLQKFQTAIDLAFAELKAAKEAILNQYLASLLWDCPDEIPKASSSIFEGNLEDSCLDLQQLPIEFFAQKFSKKTDYKLINGEKMKMEKDFINLEIKTEIKNQTQTKMNGKKKLNINSKIFENDPDGDAKNDYLLAQLGYPSKLNLLFRASQHSFYASKFHQFCDNIPNTVTIVRTKLNRTIAAYTPLKWEATNKKLYSADKSSKTFLLQLELREKMTLLQGQEQYAIYNNRKWGPMFGRGCDLAVANQCNQFHNSYANFPSSFNCETKSDESMKSQNNFSGVKSGQSFLIAEYEVFEVIK